MIFETHGHYDDTQFDEDREQLIAEFLEKDIDKVMNVGADMQSSRNFGGACRKISAFLCGSRRTSE